MLRAQLDAIYIQQSSLTPSFSPTLVKPLGSKQRTPNPQESIIQASLRNGSENVGFLIESFRENVLGGGGGGGVGIWSLLVSLARHMAK